MADDGGPVHPVPVLYLGPRGEITSEQAELIAEQTKRHFQNAGGMSVRAHIATEALKGLLACERSQKLGISWCAQHAVMAADETVWRLGIEKGKTDG